MKETTIKRRLSALLATTVAAMMVFSVPASMPAAADAKVPVGVQGLKNG